MLYCNVDNGQILTAPRPLPDALIGQSDEAILAAGWVPVVFLNMPHHVEVNVITEVIDMVLTLNGNVVEVTHVAASKAPSEVEATIMLLQAQLRSQRDELLLRTDWTQGNDAPLSAAQVQEWQVYRQALRDLPQTTTDLANIVWPTRPAK